MVQIKEASVTHFLLSSFLKESFNIKMKWIVLGKLKALIGGNDIFQYRLYFF